MEIQQILQSAVSAQKAIWLQIDQEVSIQQVLDQIKSDTYRDKIEKLRHFLSTGDIDSYNMHKRNLPAVTFCGTFETNRRKDNLLSYNEVVVIDIDKLDTKEFQRINHVLNNDPYVFSFWTSPSNHGFKGLVNLDYPYSLEAADIDVIHKRAFVLLAQYFAEIHHIFLDESGCDITRLCFLSYDPNLVLKTQVLPFPISEKSSQQEAQGYPENYVEEKRLLQHKNSQVERKIVEDIILFLEKSALSITETYEQWFRVAYGLAEAFTFKIGLGYYLALCAMDGNRYNEGASRNMFYYCYKNSTGEIKFNTVVFYAVQQGYKIVSSGAKHLKGE